MTVVVGVPRALSYYTYYPLWKNFLETLGFEVVLSNPTNKEILEGGIRETVSDACIPIKLFHGHVLDLKDKVDFLFIPRMISADGRATFCPKFLGLPDMVRYSGIKLPPIIDPRFNIRRVPGGMARFLASTAKSLGKKTVFPLAKASFYALKKQRIYQGLLLAGMLPGIALKVIEEGRAALSAQAEKGLSLIRKMEGKLTVALLGYPYALYDPFFGGDFIQRLLDLDIELITPERVHPKQMRRMARIMPQNYFWHYSNRVNWAGLFLLQQENTVDGVIHVTAFGCGPDAMVDKYLELEMKEAGLPFITLTIDEHTGEGGVQTRLEAFADMLRAKKEGAMVVGD